MSEPKWWKEALVDEYRRCRLFPGWQTIYDLHDQEDRDYYDMLDKMGIKNKMIMEAPQC
jgi:hypothetical protein